MTDALTKFAAAWFAAALLCAAALFLTSGGPGSLSPSYQAEQLGKCDTMQATFSDADKAQCRADAARLLERKAGEARSDLMFWHAIVAIVVLAIGAGFVVRLVQRAGRAGTSSAFGAMRGAWLGCLLATALVPLVLGLFALVSDALGGWARVMDPGHVWKVIAALIVAWAATFWIGTRIACPPKMLPSIPFA